MRYFFPFRSTIKKILNCGKIFEKKKNNLPTKNSSWATSILNHQSLNPNHQSPKFAERATSMSTFSGRSYNPCICIFCCFFKALELEFLMDHLQESFEYIVAKWKKFIKPWKHKVIENKQIFLLKVSSFTKTIFHTDAFAFSRNPRPGIKSYRRKLEIDRT